MPYIDLIDVELNYRVDGRKDAPAVVFSNSLGADLTMWDAQIPLLVDRYQVVRYDTRGHGESSAPQGPYSIAELARDVLALTGALGIDRFVFCGLSMGGAIGQWLAINAAERVSRLVLSNTGAKIGNDQTWNARIEAVRNGGLEAIADAVLARWFTAGFLARSPDIVASVRSIMVAADVDGYLACCEAIRAADQRDAVSSIAVPTLVISGTHDVSTPPHDGRFLADRIRGARYVELDAAHVSNIEAAERWNAVLSDFLQGPGDGRS